MRSDIHSNRYARKELVSGNAFPLPITIICISFFNNYNNNNKDNHFRLNLSRNFNEIDVCRLNFSSNIIICNSLKKIYWYYLKCKINKI